MRKLLVEINFRLRNIEEYNLIKKKFTDNEYEVLNIENFNHRELKYDFLFKYFIENKIKENYEKIVIISNIEDAIFLWHRLYNFLADDFIFFIDKYNYSLFKEKIYEVISEMNSIEKEKLDEIYININYQNIERIEKKINDINRINYIKIIEEIELKKSKIKQEESKRYTFGDEKIEHCVKNKGIKVIKLEKKEQNTEIKEVAEKLENNTRIMLLYIIFSYKKILGNTELMIRLNSIFKLCFDYLGKNNKLKKIYEKIFDIFEKENIIEGMWKIQLCQLLVIAGCKDSRILSISMKELKERVDTDKYKYVVMIQLFFNSYMNKVEIYGNFNYEIRDLLNEISKKYSEKIIIKENKKEDSRKKIAIIADQLMSIKHSTAKAVLDYAINMKKYVKNSDIKIFIEDNFRQSIQEGILINQYNSASSKIAINEHINYLKENKSEDIEIYYSNDSMCKKDRLIEMIEEVSEFNPEIILNMNNAYSLSMEFLSKYFNSYYLTLGLVNWQDNQIYNFYFEGVNKSELPQFQNNIITKTRAVNFKRKESIYLREKLGLKKEEFVMISVSLMPEADFNKEYIEEIFKSLLEHDNIKLIIVGTERLSFIDENLNYKIVKNKIKYIKYEHNLGALYQICDIYINPPRNGGGFSVAEAMYYGLPVISLKTSRDAIVWLGRENGVEDMKEYIEKIDKLKMDKFYYNNEKEKMLDRVKNWNFKNYLEEIFFYIENGR